jgi:radical SAM superfamily enzyme YgiQ (UPF0313 family)
MSNLGFHSLFHRVSAFRGIRTARFFIERGSELFSPEAFLPEKKGIFRAAPPTLKSFDLILFTVAFELDYVNVVRMLKLSSIPTISSKRDEKCPLVITGGIAPSANPLPLSVFSDLVCVGDMEDLLEGILEILFTHDFRKSNEALGVVEKLKGVYRTGGGAPTRWIKKDIAHPAHTVIITLKTAFQDMFLIEVVRGCRQNCTFCMTRCVTRPVRTVKSELITRTVKRVVSHTKKVGLIAPVLSDHPDLIEIVKQINALGCVVSFSSLRADAFTEELAGLLRANGQNSVTFAPETGTFALRRQIGKILTDEDLFHAVLLAVKNGIKKFRYYIMYGLPGETTDDIRSIALISKKTVDLISQAGCTLYLSVNPFVPKKGTALEHESIYPLDYYREMQHLLKKELEGIPRLSVKFETIRLLYMHYRLSLGTEETGYLLDECVSKGSMRQFHQLETRGQQ